jgi:protoporphyrinogen oxidase
LERDPSQRHVGAAALVADFLQQPVLFVPAEAAGSLDHAGRLGIGALRIFVSRRARFPKSDPKTFEDWVTNQFGARLFRTFFKTYTEKVWDISCKEISADWAAQRIKGLSLGSAIKNGLFARKISRESQIKTLRHSATRARAPA